MDHVHQRDWWIHSRCEIISLWCIHEPWFQIIMIQIIQQKWTLRAWSQVTLGKMLLITFKQPIRTSKLVSQDLLNCILWYDKDCNDNKISVSCIQEQQKNLWRVLVSPFQKLFKQFICVLTPLPKYKELSVIVQATVNKAVRVQFLQAIYMLLITTVP